MAKITEQEWQTQFNEAETAFYFASADKKTRIVGLELHATYNETESFRAWQQAQARPVFGGIPFDEQAIASKLMSGGFWAPALAYDLNSGHSWGSLADQTSVPMEQVEPAVALPMETAAEWAVRMQPAVTTMQTDPTKQKVVLARQRSLRLTQPLDVGQLLASLAEQQPNSYHVVFKLGDELFVSATPERLVKLTPTTFETAAVAGSAPRGTTHAADLALGVSLLTDPKNLQEHALVVEMLKERLTGLVQLNPTDGPQLLKTPQIQHLYTPMQGPVTDDLDLLALVQRLHPTPALGGAPREWALAEIKNREQAPRGLFAAPIGVVLPDNTGEFVIGIRSFWGQAQQLRLFAGAGILAQSDLPAEAAEIALKMTPMYELLKAQGIEDAE